MNQLACEQKKMFVVLLLASRGSTPPWSRVRVGRGTQTKPQMQRPGHTGRKALATKKKFVVLLLARRFLVAVADRALLLFAWFL